VGLRKTVKGKLNFPLINSTEIMALYQLLNLEV